MKKTSALYSTEYCTALRCVVPLCCVRVVLGKQAREGLVKVTVTRTWRGKRGGW